MAEVATASRPTLGRPAVKPGAGAGPPKVQQRRTAGDILALGAAEAEKAPTGPSLRSARMTEAADRAEEVGSVLLPLPEPPETQSGEGAPPKLQMRRTEGSPKPKDEARRSPREAG